MTFTVDVLSDTQAECNDDGPAPACSDPFAIPPPPLPEPARDGGIRLPGAVDAYVANTGPDATLGGDAFIGSTSISDAQAASGIGQSAAPQDQRLGGASGCSCSLTGPSRDTSLLVFTMAGLLAVLARRSRTR